jgi:hypothetical protein
VLKSAKAFGLDVNNGLVALTYGLPAPTAPTITSVTHTGNSSTLIWTTFNGRNYQSQGRDSLANGSWLDIGGPIVGNGTTATNTDLTASGNVRFYRVLAY